PPGKTRDPALIRRRSSQIICSLTVPFATSSPIESPSSAILFQGWKQHPVDRGLWQAHHADFRRPAALVRLCAATLAAGHRLAAGAK
ncbi:MAG: hypothetical protein INF18_13735, partial [Methylobacterium sp.]|nr:hypothetical protein [Methylobacterium sp.]